MPIGDQKDMYHRLRSNLVPWFGTNEFKNNGANPPQLTNINLLLTGIATMDVTIYDQIDYVKKQTRIATATDINLDYIALDYLGGNFLRRKDENDESFRTRILANIVQEKATRKGMIEVLTKLTGRTPVVIEGFNPVCIGAYDENLYYDQQGGSGFLGPYIAIIYVFRPQPIGFLDYGAYDVISSIESSFGYDFLLNNAYVDITHPVITISDDDIFYAIEHTKVYGTYMYVYIFD